MRAVDLPGDRIAVFYLARGADADALRKVRAFRESYVRWKAGADHDLHVIFKGFTGAAQLARAREEFADVAHAEIFLDDAGLDLGAYFKAASRVTHPRVCFLNTASEILGVNWLGKLAANLVPGVGMVSCSGNYEAPQHPGRENVPFPNPHLRSNGFLIRRDDFLAFQPDTGVADKMDAYMLEHGPASFTRRLAGRGLRSLVVGRNGRGYDVESWPHSETFRLGTQTNLLIGDNQTASYAQARLHEKYMLNRLSWGDPQTRRPLAGVMAGLAAGGKAGR